MSEKISEIFYKLVHETLVTGLSDKINLLQFPPTRGAKLQTFTRWWRGAYLKLLMALLVKSSHPIGACTTKRQVKFNFNYVLSAVKHYDAIPSSSSVGTTVSPYLPLLLTENPDSSGKLRWLSFPQHCSW